MLDHFKSCPCCWSRMGSVFLYRTTSTFYAVLEALAYWLSIKSHVTRPTSETCFMKAGTPVAATLRRPRDWWCSIIFLLADALKVNQIWLYSWLFLERGNSYSPVYGRVVLWLAERLASSVYAFWMHLLSRQDFWLTVSPKIFYKPVEVVTHSAKMLVHLLETSLCGPL